MSAIRAASAFVELSLRQSAFKKGLKGAERSLAETEAKLRGLGLAAAGIGAGALTAFTAAVSRASDLSEAVSKSSNVFGEASKMVQDFAATSASAFGISKRAANDYASELGLILLKTGSTQAESAKMAVSLTKLAADIASLNNISIDEALGKLKAGLVGSSEPLRSVGVLLSAAAVKAKAAELGLEKVDGQFTEGAKVAARYALILEQTQETQGDFARTSNGLANTNRRIIAAFEDIVSVIGGAVLPIYETVANAIADMSAPIVEFVSNNQQLIRNVFLAAVGLVAFGGALIAAGAAVSALPVLVGALATVWGVVTSAVGVAASAVGVVGAAIAFLASPVGIALTVIGTLIGAFFTMTSAGQAVVNWFSSNFIKLFETVSSTVKGIATALSNGNLSLAAEIGFTGIKLAIAQIMEEVESIFGISLQNIFAGLAKLVQSVLGVIGQLNELRQRAVSAIADGLAAAGEAVGLLPENTRAVLQEDNKRAETRAAEFTKSLTDFDPSDIGKKIRDEFDPDKLKAKLAKLTKSAEKPISKDADEAVKKVEQAKFGGFESFDLNSLKQSVGDGQDKIKSQGSFIGAAVAQGTGSISSQMFALQKQQLEFEKKKEAKEAQRAKEQLEATKANNPTAKVSVK